MQNSRDRILAAVAANKPDLLPLPEIPVFNPDAADASFILEKFGSFKPILLIINPPSVKNIINLTIKRAIIASRSP